jgi:hypothetical protein
VKGGVLKIFSNTNQVYGWCVATGCGWFPVLCVEQVEIPTVRRSGCYRLAKQGSAR